MKLFKKTLLLILTGILLLVAYILINTFTFPSNQLLVDPIDPIAISNAAIANFSKAIQIKTISPEDPADFDSLEFNKFNEFLKDTYPLTDSLLEKKVFHQYSSLYKWEGQDASLNPIVLMAHLDVVPVIEENIPDWRMTPFGGEIEKDTIWGRGTIDDKIGVIGILEAVEMLLSEGMMPRRTIYLSFGHDEEIGGKGAQSIAAYLKAEKVEAEFVLDEGGSIVERLIPGIQKEVALIGIAEKGFASVRLSVKVEGGHSSIPEKETAIDVLATAISKLKRNPFEARISEPIEGFIESLGPEMTFVNKMAFANKSIFSPLIIQIYDGSASGSALIRTTISPTMFNSGVKENIIPLTANATVNFRLLPGTTLEDVLAHVGTSINDPRIDLDLGPFNSEASKVSSTDSFGYDNIQKTIAEIYPNVLVSPYLMVGASDARHFAEISDNIYRFSTIHINPGNIKSFHGLNERISVKDFKNSVRFYRQIIRNTTM